MRLLTGVLELLVPLRCLDCGEAGAMPWCDHCVAAADERRLVDPCPRCAATAGAGDPHLCWPRSAPIVSTIAAFDYREPIATAVVGAKTRALHAAWPGLGALLADRVAQAQIDVDAVTFVPTEPRRRRERGVDHGAVLAREIARRTELRCVPLLAARKGTVDTTAPNDTGSTRPASQTPFVSLRQLRGGRLLLVDDVLTTGATASAAARALLDCGATAVHLAVLARAGSHPLQPGATVQSADPAGSALLRSPRDGRTGSASPPGPPPGRTRPREEAACTSRSPARTSTSPPPSATRR